MFCSDPREACPFLNGDEEEEQMGRGDGSRREEPGGDTGVGK